MWQRAEAGREGDVDADVHNRKDSRIQKGGGHSPPPAQRRPAAGHVDDGAPGEVLHAPAPDEAVRVPHPVRHRAVDNQAVQHDEDQEGAEAHALDEAARGQGGRDDGELQLEQGEQLEWDCGQGGTTPPTWAEQGAILPLPQRAEAPKPESARKRATMLRTSRRTKDGADWPVDGRSGTTHATAEAATQGAG